jgi:hypothetical protein
LIAFDRMGRAMRLALSLRRRFAGEARAEAVQRVQVRKERLKAALAPAIRLRAPFEDRQALDWALAHRLEAEAFADLSFDAGVARLSQLLGLTAVFAPAEVKASQTQELPAQSLADLVSPDLVACARCLAAQATGPP